MGKRTFEYHDKIFEYILIKKNIKSLRLKVDAKGDVIVHAPKFLSERRIQDFIISNQRFIDNRKKKACQLDELINIHAYTTGEYFCLFGKLLEIRYEKSEKNKVVIDTNHLIIYCNKDDIQTRKHLFENYIKKECKTIFQQRLQHFYPMFNQKVKKLPTLSIRFMKTRWGSCKPSDNKITLNAKLAFVEPEFLDIIILHEYCHFYHLNHSKRFYDVLISFLPQYKKDIKYFNQKYAYLYMQ